jgi:hypothetical protein
VAAKREAELVKEAPRQPTAEQRLCSQETRQVKVLVGNAGRCDNGMAGSVAGQRHQSNHHRVRGAGLCPPSYPALRNFGILVCKLLIHLQCGAVRGLRRLQISYVLQNESEIEVSSCHPESKVTGGGLG